MSRYKAYPAYRDSGVEWLGNIPCDWDCVRLKFASELSGEKVAPSNEERYVGLENVQSNSGKFITTEEITPEGISSTFSCGDVLLGKLRPYLAKSWLADFSGICSSEFLVLTSKKINAKFLHYFTLTEEFIKQVDSSTYGSKMPRASWDFIGLLDIPVPCHESEKIAAFLDHETAKIDALIEKQQRLIELLKEKRQAVISHAVTKGLNPNAPMKDSGVEWLGEVPAHWALKNYRYATRIYRGKFGHRPRNDPALYDGPHPFIQTGDVAQAGKRIVDYKQTLNERGAAVSQKFPAGTLVMAIAANIGDTAILDFEAYAPDSVVGFKPFPDLDLEFLRYSLMAALPALEQTSTQSAQANLNIDRIGSVQAVFPPLGEQLEIVSYLDRLIDRYAEIEEKALVAIETMQERRTALISAAVTGKIDVRDWQPAAA